MLSQSTVVAFVATTDLTRAQEFYVGVLGLDLVEESPFAAVFATPGGPLRVTPVEKLIPAGYTVLGWEVDGIEEAVTGLAARGVVFSRYDGMAQDDLGIWTAPGGARVAWFSDPDGNTLSLSEHPAPAVS